MASSNNDKTIEYDEEMYKKPNPAKVYLPEFAVKLQEKANRIYIPPPPLTNSAHRSVSEVDVFFPTSQIIKFFVLILVNQISSTIYWVKLDVSIN